MKVAYYRNGDAIVTGLNPAEWNSTGEGAYAVYNDDPANDVMFGKLYNSFAMNDPRGLCPEGWLLPSDDEWQTLELEMGMPTDELDVIGWRGSSENVGGRLKSTTSWNTPNAGANNRSGFSALAAGFRRPNGTYDFKNEYIGFWTSDYLLGVAWGRYLGFDDRGVDRHEFDLCYGYSCRCVKD